MITQSASLGSRDNQHSLDEESDFILEPPSPWIIGNPRQHARLLPLKILLFQYHSESSPSMSYIQIPAIPTARKLVDTALLLQIALLVYCACINAESYGSFGSTSVAYRSIALEKLT